MSDKIEVSVDSGKYRFRFEDGKLTCDRYNEPWRDFIGDKAVLSLVMELAELRAENGRQAEELRQHAEYIPALTERMLAADSARGDEGVSALITTHNNPEHN